MSVDPDAMLAGPRGRRFLLAFALECERALRPDDGGEHPLRFAVMLASHRLDPGRGRSRVLFGPQVDLDAAAPDVVASSLSKTPLVDPEPGILLRSFTEAVDWAMYWQEPAGEDVLAATPAVVDALRRVAAHVASSPSVSWWTRPIARDDQHTVTWAGEAPARDRMSVAGRLTRWRSDVAQQEERARRERPTDPTAPYSGEWWSTPPSGLLRTTRSLAGRGPLGLWLVEDGQGWEQATTCTVPVPDGARVYEVDGAESWAELCRSHPAEVSAQKRHDWYRTTGRDGRWVVPHWSDIALRYDAVHLTAAAYLTAAGTPISVDDDAASVIANWNPDETYWFSDAPVPTAAATPWSRDDVSGWTPLARPSDVVHPDTVSQVNGTSAPG